MACAKCQKIKKWMCRCIYNADHAKYEEYHDHAKECLHFANYCLINLLSNTSTNIIQSMLYFEGVQYYEGPLKYYVFQNEVLFTIFWISFVSCVAELLKESRQSPDIRTSLIYTISRVTSFKKKQIAWILEDSMLLKQFKKLCEALDSYLSTDNIGNETICLYLHYLGLKGLSSDRFHIHFKKYITNEYQNGIDFLSPLFRDKKCGNLRCKTDYIYDCFGKEYGKATQEYDVKFWTTVIMKKRWKICKGCKTTYYCSRRCQKKAWIQGHKQQCQKLQKLITNIDTFTIKFQ